MFLINYVVFVLLVKTPAEYLWTLMSIISILTHFPIMDMPHCPLLLTIIVELQNEQYLGQSIKTLLPSDGGAG